MRADFGPFSQADWWLLFVAFVAVASLAGIFRSDILAFVKPRREAIVAARFSWLVPVAVLVAVEFPPLGGHAVTVVATGAIWGFVQGMPIALGGTLLGETLCFLAFRTVLRKRAERCV